MLMMRGHYGPRLADADDAWLLRGPGFGGRGGCGVGADADDAGYWWLSRAGLGKLMLSNAEVWQGPDGLMTMVMVIVVVIMMMMMIMSECSVVRGWWGSKC